MASYAVNKPAVARAHELIEEYAEWHLGLTGVIVMWG